MRTHPPNRPPCRFGPIAALSMCLCSGPCWASSAATPVDITLIAAVLLLFLVAACYAVSRLVGKFLGPRPQVVALSILLVPTWVPFFASPSVASLAWFAVLCVSYASCKRLSEWTGMSPLESLLAVFYVLSLGVAYAQA